VSAFQFKQFQVRQDQCAMKVGTDGVLLGAWAGLTQASSILDIGTGTGLMALMSAQRNENCNVKALEIDTGAALQARENVENSPFANRVEVIHADVLAYETEETFDFIICNPPFFNGSYKPGAQARTLARHQESLTLRSLMEVSKRLGSVHHILALVFPRHSFNEQRHLIDEVGYSIKRICYVKPNPSKPAHRVLIELALPHVSQLEETELSIELSRHIYTEEYKALCRDFYLAM